MLISQSINNMTESKSNFAAMTDEERKYKIKAGAFLGIVASSAALIGFSKTVSAAKKHDQQFLEQTGVANAGRLLEGGSALAMRALAWGTFYAFLGTGALCFGVWKLSGAKDMKEFREKIGSSLPKITSDKAPTSKTEFDGLTDLLKYLSSWGKE